MPENEISQKDIEAFWRANIDAVSERVKKEVVVTFFDKRARDTIMG